MRRRTGTTAAALGTALVLVFAGAASGHENTTYDFSGDAALVQWWWQADDGTRLQANLALYEGSLATPGSKGKPDGQTRSLVDMSLSISSCADDVLTWTLLRGSTWIEGQVFVDRWNVVVGSEANPVRVILVGDTVEIASTTCSGSATVWDHVQTAAYEFTGPLIETPPVKKRGPRMPAETVFIGTNLHVVATPDPAWSALEWIVGPDLGAETDHVVDLLISHNERTSLHTHEPVPDGS